jgi:hypothetical protein
MTAIADASGDASALWGWQAWAIFLLAVAVVLGGWWLVIQIMTAPTRAAEPSELDRLDGKAGLL